MLVYTGPEGDFMATAAPTRSLLKAGADDARRYWLEEGRAPGGFVKQVDPAELAELDRALAERNRPDFVSPTGG